MAYFVLGYREYDSGEYFEAAKDLAKLTDPGFFLADYATYYCADAALKSNNPAQASDEVRNFTSNFPSIPLRLQALAVLAQALMNLQKPKEAIQVLTESRVRRRADLSLLLAKAYEQADDLPQAVHSFQEVYFPFPAFPPRKNPVIPWPACDPPWARVSLSRRKK